MSSSVKGSRPYLNPYQLLLRWIMAGAAVAMMGEVSINPFGTAFRFSLGPIMFVLLILFFPMLQPFPVAVIAGLVIVGLHTAADMVIPPGGSWLPTFLGTMSKYGPEIVAYTVLGAVSSLGKVQGRLNRPLAVAAVLAAGDFSANLVELLVRQFRPTPKAVLITALIAVGRAAVAAGLFEVARASERERRWSAERQNYARRLLFVAHLQTDIFFLRKSAREIEAVMERAHRLYRDLKGQPTQPEALGVATDIHEVKKDYQRTMASLAHQIDMPDLATSMSFSEVVHLVADANAAYAETLGKQISFVIDLQADFTTIRFGRWVSILNNVVCNAIESSQELGHLTIYSTREGEWFRVDLSDTGAGIPVKDQGLIFSAGFSTKLNAETGSFSSGLGLTHVAELVRSMRGEIVLAHSSPAGTTFRIKVPWSALEISVAEV